MSPQTIKGISFVCTQVRVQKLDSQLGGLGEDLAPVGVGDLPPLAPLVGGKYALALEVQPQDAEGPSFLRLDLGVHRLALESVLFLDAVLVDVGEEAAEYLYLAGLEPLDRRVFEPVRVHARRDAETLGHPRRGLHFRSPLALDVHVEEQL
jgi:hypothetical protein